MKRNERREMFVSARPELGLGIYIGLKLGPGKPEDCRKAHSRRSSGLINTKYKVGPESLGSPLEMGILLQDWGMICYQTNSFQAVKTCSHRSKNIQYNNTFNQ